MWLQPLSVDSNSDDEVHQQRREDLAPPPAPKRRRVNRQQALAGFAAAARLETINPTKAVENIQATFRGYRVRREVARLRPTSSSSSASSSGPLEEVPEEIEEDLSCCLSVTQDLTSLTLVNAPVDSALETSGEFLESSNDSLADGLREFRAELAAGPNAPSRLCAICLQDMPKRRRNDGGGPQPAPTSPGMKVATLECGHKFHRKCLLGWCRRQPPGQCPMCRAEVRVRTCSSRADGEASSSAAPLVR